MPAQHHHSGIQPDTHLDTIHTSCSKVCVQALVQLCWFLRGTNAIQNLPRHNTNMCIS